ncbi:inositol monophosphatase family protein [Dermacoccaceae bacterium W4C1]
MSGPDREPGWPTGELEQLAIDLAAEAGALILARPPELGVAATKSSPTDVVTVMDRRSETLLRDRIAAARPDDAVLGEEEADTPGSSGLTWVIDPIDGTVNYLYDIGAYAVSVAVCTGDPRVPGAWETVAAAVFNPVTGEMFHARAGGGAWLRRGDGAPARLQVRDSTDLSAALVGTGFGYRPQVRQRQGEVLARVLPQVRDIRRAGSAALDLCSVAAGRLDGYYESGLNPWDMAGGVLLVTEAGGAVLGADGGPAGTALTVAAGPRLAPALAACVQA